MSEGESGSDGPVGARRRRRGRVGRTGARFPRPLDDDVPEPEDTPDATPGSSDGTTDGTTDGTADGTTDGTAEGTADASGGLVLPGESGSLPLTGARFGSHARRARKEAARAAEQDAAVPEQAPPPARRQPEPDDAPTIPLFITAPPPPESTRTRVRPYVRTRGRTRARADLAVETLVSIPSPRPPLEDPEHVAVGDVVDDPRSVAEVAALLAVPLGVARVIIDDMAGAGLLLVHPRAVATSGAPSLDIMQRVLDGLHRL